MYVGVCIHVYVYVYVYLYICVYMCMYVNICVYVGGYVCVCICVCVCMCICVRNFYTCRNFCPVVLSLYVYVLVFLRTTMEISLFTFCAILDIHFMYHYIHCYHLSLYLMYMFWVSNKIKSNQIKCLSSFCCINAYFEREYIGLVYLLGHHNHTYSATYLSMCLLEGQTHQDTHAHAHTQARIHIILLK